MDLHNLERWHTNILNAIHQGYAETPEGEKIQLNNMEGIDILGNMIESSILSPNRNFYGNLHNNAHVIIGVSKSSDLLNNQYNLKNFLSYSSSSMILNKSFWKVSESWAHRKLASFKF